MRTALLAAPCCWLLYAMWFQPVGQLNWPWHAPWIFLSAALLYPVLEELTFRGLIQGYLRQYFGQLNVLPYIQESVEL